jgi:predicted transcriptional regulator
MLLAVLSEEADRTSDLAAGGALHRTRYAHNMEVRLTPELENELASIAARSGRTAQELAADVLTRGLQHERRFIESVEQGIASADVGRLIPDEDVLAWLEAQEARESS